MKCIYQKDSKKCNAYAMKGSKYCYFHNPAISAKEKKKSRSTGGCKNKFVQQKLPAVTIENINDVKTGLIQLINELREGSIDNHTARTSAYILNQYVKTVKMIEFEQKIYELNQKLDNLITSNKIN